jgi:hypothetical protein
MLAMRKTRGSVVACAHPGTALLALPLSVMALAFAPAAPARAAELEEPSCQPWICRPSTAGVATVEGTVTSTRNLSPAAFAYRPVQFNREANGSYDEERFGPLRSAKLKVEQTPTGTFEGTFKLSLPACSAASRVFGCLGGEYEGYATYNGQMCSATVYIYMTVEELNQLPSTLLECVPPKPKQKKGKGKPAKHHR